MSIAVRGTLTIERKQGRNGAFNVGDLHTEIGIFEVKDALIEEYEAGRYTGTFVISWIEPDSFSWRGRVFVKIRATLVEIIVDDADEQEQLPPAPPPEPDPAEAPSPAPRRADKHSARPVAPATDDDNQKPTAPVAGTERQSAPHEPAAQQGSDAHERDLATPCKADERDADKTLFGDELHELLLAHQPIKLDPTVDRIQFRAQRDRIKALGYRFDARLQTWSMPA